VLISSRRRVRSEECDNEIVLALAIYGSYNLIERTITKAELHDYVQGNLHRSL
jgi:hypothetical protein